MKTPGRKIFAIACALTLAMSAVAFAAGPLHGKTYKGQTAATGKDVEGHTITLHPAGVLELKVASNGSTVTVHFPQHAAVLYCLTTLTLHSQSTKPAKISSNGSFKASVGERFQASAGSPPVTQIITGRFSGGTVKGTIHTSAAECSGTTAFTAKVG
jgi:hypothetical protein